MKEPEVIVKVEYTEGYEKRYTEAVLSMYQRKANRENRVISGVFYPQNRDIDLEQVKKYE